MSAIKTIAVLTAVALLCCANARAEIYRCTDDDGNLVFQQTPCVKKEPVEDQAEESPLRDAGVTEEGPIESSQATEAQASKDRDNESLPDATQQPAVVQLCKKKYRDAIDAIDAEMRQDYSSEQGEAYRQRLQVLTVQLRAC